LEDKCFRQEQATLDLYFNSTTTSSIKVENLNLFYI